MKLLASGMLVIGLMLISVTCDQQRGRWRREIESLEQKMSDSPPDTLPRALVTRYLRYADAYPNDGVWTPAYLYRAAGVYYRVGNFAEAARLLRIADVEYPKAAIHADVLLLAAIIADEEMNDAANAQALYQRLMSQYPEHPGRERAVLYLQPTSERMRQRMKQYEQIVFGAKSTQDFDPNAGLKLARLYEEYATRYPQDPQSVEYLFQGAKLATSAGLPGKGIEMWLLIVERYPTHDRASWSLFSAAFSAENNLRDVKQAGELYRQFIAKYPKHAMADDARISLSNLGKTPDEALSNLLSTPSSKK